MRKAMAKVRDKWRKQGLSPSSGKGAPAPHRTLCTRCLEARRVNAQVLADKLNPNRQRLGPRLPEIPKPEFKGVCEICSKDITLRQAHLDHDHKTGKSRGWLCPNCNIGLGFFRDSIENLKAAIAYLARSTVVGSAIDAYLK